MPFIPDKPTPGFIADTPKTPGDNGHSSGESSPLQRKVPNYDEIMASRPDLQKIVTGIQSGGVGEIAAPLGGLAASAGKWGLNKLSSFLAPAAEKSAILSAVKSESGLGPMVASKLKDAASKFNEAQIAPKMASQNAKAVEQFVPFEPDKLSGIHPDIDANVSRLSQYYDKEIPMSEAIKLRGQLNSSTLFKSSPMYDPTVMAAKSKALDAGNSIRTSIAQADPSVTDLSDKLVQDYKLRDSVISQSSKKSPIAAVKAGIGTDKASNISRFDDAAGTDLRGLGQNINLAQQRLGGSSSLPKTATDVGYRALSTIPRAYDASAQGGKAVSDMASQALSTPTGQTASQLALQALLQSRNKSQDGQ